ncbi:hypothetical protein D6833_05385 [Candidatus Parcubacteria bacterium]|nr:MAG: hypothetical protein D6833_05385 [Candidatus Parcubacteria bacterium]
MSYQTFRNTICWSIVVILLAYSSSIQSQDNNWRYAYFFSGIGKFVKVEVATNRVVARGSLLEIEGARHLFPEFEPNISVWGYDRHTGWVYVTAPIEDLASKKSDPVLRYRVVVLTLPEFQLVGHAELAEPVYQGPNLLLTPDGKRLLVSYEVVSDDDAYWVFVREIYDTRGLRRIELKRARVAREPYDPEAVARARFTRKARFAADGETIIDGRYEIVGDRVFPHRPAPWPEEVSKYRQAHPDFFVVRLDKGGRRLLLWELKQNQKVKGRYYQRYATGRFALYEALATPRLREYRLAELEGGFPRVVAVTPGGDKVYFAVGKEKLYVIEVTKGMKVNQIDLGGLSALHVTCVFADR